MSEQSREHRIEPPQTLQAGAEYQEVGTKRKFRLDRKLGEGALGVVYLATNLSNGMEHAIKFMKPQILKDQEFVDRFEREIAVGGQFPSPFILKVIDRVELSVGGEKQVGFVTEYVKGRNLLEELNYAENDGIQGRMRPEHVAEYIAEAALAISTMSKAGFVHRDIKPENIYLQTLPDGSKLVRIGDFGLTAPVKGWKYLRQEMNPPEHEKQFFDESHKRVTFHATVLGTPEYMSPDLFADTDVTEKSDIYALGVVCYQLLTGELPFTGYKNLDDLEKMVKKSPPRSFKEVDAQDVPQELQQLVMRMLEKKAKDRIDAMEVFEKMKEWVSKNHPKKMKEMPFMYDFKKPKSLEEALKEELAA